MDNRELELRKALARNEKERDRSQKWFFINFFVAIFFILFTLWAFPYLSQFIVKLMGKLEVSKTDALLLNSIRSDYLKWGIFFLWAADASFWLFWVGFRFRKWTNYRHQVHVLKEELDKLEREKK